MATVTTSRLALPERGHRNLQRPVRWNAARTRSLHPIETRRRPSAVPTTDLPARASAYPCATLTARAMSIAKIANDMVLSIPITSFALREYGMASVGENAVAAVSDTYR